MHHLLGPKELCLTSRALDKNENDIDADCDGHDEREEDLGQEERIVPPQDAVVGHEVEKPRNNTGSDWRQPPRDDDRNNTADIGELFRTLVPLHHRQGRRRE